MGPFLFPPNLPQLVRLVRVSLVNQRRAFRPEMSLLAALPALFLRWKLLFLLKSVKPFSSILIFAIFNKLTNLFFPVFLSSFLLTKLCPCIALIAIAFSRAILNELTPSNCRMRFIKPSVRR